MSSDHPSDTAAGTEKDLAHEISTFSDSVFSLKQSWRDAVAQMKPDYSTEANLLDEGFKVRH